MPVHTALAALAFLTMLQAPMGVGAARAEAAPAALPQSEAVEPACPLPIDAISREYVRLGIVDVPIDAGGPSPYRSCPAGVAIDDPTSLQYEALCIVEITGAEVEC